MVIFNSIHICKKDSFTLCFIFKEKISFSFSTCMPNDNGVDWGKNKTELNISMFTVDIIFKL